MNKTNCMTIQHAGTTTLFEARTGTLQFNDTKRRTNGETSCELCKGVLKGGGGSGGSNPPPRNFQIFFEK